MNVSMQDGFNLGWKLAAVLRGRAAPGLLHTYSAERQAIAKELIDFDREWASMLASAAEGRVAPMPAEDAELFRQARALHRRHGDPLPPLAPHRRSRPISIWPRGCRSACASIPRRSSALADAKPVHLGHAVAGRWPLAHLRLCRRGGSAPRAPASARCAIFSPSAANRRSAQYTPAGERHRRGDRRPRGLPAGSSRARRRGDAGVAAAAQGTLRLASTTRRCSAPTSKSGQDIFTMRGIDREGGCIVVVRPDQYVAHVLPLDALRARGVLRRVHAASELTLKQPWRCQRKPGPRAGLSVWFESRFPACPI